MAGNKQKTIQALLSMWALLARSCFYKILAVLAAMVCLEGSLFCWNLRKAEEHALESVTVYSRASVIFIVALGMFFVILIGMETMLDTKGRYTLGRLKVTRAQFLSLKAVFNILCLMVLFAVQIGMAFWMVWMCIKKGEYKGNEGQALFLAFYMDEFLHCLLPMAEMGKWVRNILMILALGMEAAGSAGKKYGIFMYFVLAASCFVSPIGFNTLDAVCNVAYFIGIVVFVAGISSRLRELE